MHRIIKVTKGNCNSTIMDRQINYNRVGTHSLMNKLLNKLKPIKS